jgi:hypothetical protein
MHTLNLSDETLLKTFLYLEYLKYSNSVLGFSYEIISPR